MGLKFIEQRKHILMEKPMTVDVAEARTLADHAASASLQKGLAFMVNNTANFRDQSFEARRLVSSGELGAMHHVRPDATAASTAAAKHPPCSPATAFPGRLLNFRPSHSSTLCKRRPMTSAST